MNSKNFKRMVEDCKALVAMVGLPARAMSDEELIGYCEHMLSHAGSLSSGFSALRALLLLSEEDKKAIRPRIDELIVVMEKELTKAQHCMGGIREHETGRVLSVLDAGPSKEADLDPIRLVAADAAIRAVYGFAEEKVKKARTLVETYDNEMARRKKEEITDVSRN